MTQFQNYIINGKNPHPPSDTRCKRKIGRSLTINDIIGSYYMECIIMIMIILINQSLKIMLFKPTNIIRSNYLKIGSLRLFIEN